MERLGLKREDVDWIVEHADRVVEGETASEYDASLRDMLYR